eukprot:CAMPEP_0184750502 /NCGR_PEP_ID=MMETSP0315-20130426/36829_1 /TAXON_ID=101924 /ORGANISM="Rhodosorus marinus, Strain UTEX LB 2760" /LENGTH=92 /DNA_ID=CAMNT_0027228783 /DNA_START=281 /DNA_END=555 /DNA_ORIENTATION=+
MPPKVLIPFLHCGYTDNDTEGNDLAKSAPGGRGSYGIDEEEHSNEEEIEVRKPAKLFIQKLGHRVVPIVLCSPDFIQRVARICRGIIQRDLS